MKLDTKNSKENTCRGSPESPYAPTDIFLRTSLQEGGNKDTKKFVGLVIKWGKGYNGIKL